MFSHEVLSNVTWAIACAQTSPISFVPRATKEIEDVCMQATWANDSS